MCKLKFTAVPCRFCNASDPCVIVTGHDFPGSDSAVQVICGCGNAGPHAANKEDAIAYWNKVNG